jgi:D-alanyl-lipoteichoic acid acyltransferase DltB (MBOAT superfamily)
VTQLGLLVLVIRQFELENQAFYYNVMLLVFYGFLVHYFLPLEYRLPFFLLLSLVGILGVLGLLNGAWLLGIGLVMIAISHLPIPFSYRIVLLLVTSIVLVMLRTEWLQSPVPSAIWPILGSMFMFRLIIYLYDLKHSKEKANFWRSLSYFFLLPNIVFPFFPVVDFATFRRTYYNEERYRIYQRGVEWIFRGVFQLIIYRYINYYVVIAAQDVTNVNELVRFAASNFLLYFRVSGQFHLIIGLLHLFGFNLPETNNRYLLASGFTDLWRRINIYWKDFMLKIFYYPTYFKLGKLKMTSRLVTTMAVVFFMTWLLHAYQWFWLRGSFLLTVPDVVFWFILAILVIANTLNESRRGRKRTLGERSHTFRDVISQALRTAGTFSLLIFLWSLWTSESISDWISLWSIAATVEGVVKLALFFLVLTVVMGAVIWIGYLGKKPSTTEDKGQLTFFKPVVTNGLFIALLLLVSQPAVYTRLGEPVEAVIADLRSARLSDRDAELLQRGYYEDLIGVNRFNTELWDAYTKRPSDWPRIQDTEAARLTGDFQVLELVPSTQIVFHGETLSVNSWGMRDQEYEKVPPPNTYRVVLLGPSFVMGSGVADGKIFESLLEDRLNQEATGGEYAQYQILNFGLAGFSALQELVALEAEALSFQPNAIFLVGHQLEEEIAVRNLANRMLVGNDLPYDYLNDLTERAEIEVGMSQSEAERRLKPFGPELVGWTYSRVVTLARERGIVPIWIFLPALETPVLPEERAKLFNLAEDAGFVIVDLSDVYQNQDISSIIVAEWDKHPNAKGHALIAEHLYQALQQKKDEIPLGLATESP